MAEVSRRCPHAFCGGCSSDTGISILVTRSHLLPTRTRGWVWCGPQVARICCSWARDEGSSRRRHSTPSQSPHTGPRRADEWPALLCPAFRMQPPWSRAISFSRNPGWWGRGLLSTGCSVEWSVHSFPHHLRPPPLPCTQAASCPTPLEVTPKPCGSAPEVWGSRCPGPNQTCQALLTVP